MFYLFKLQTENLGEHSLPDFSDCLKYNSPLLFFNG